MKLIKNKILSRNDLFRIAQWKEEGCKICFTNGCFDLVHAGHVTYLEQASHLADRLIVAINSDSSVKKLKGQHRPIINQNDRAMLIAAFYFVDGVILFDEETPLSLIELIQPDVLVKGGDWSPENMVGSEVVMAKGGSVMTLPYLEGQSTTNIEDKIIENYKNKN